MSEQASATSTSWCPGGGDRPLGEELESLAHDLRAPLSAIRLLSEAILDGCHEAPRLRHIGNQVRCISGVLCETLESVLDARRMGTGTARWSTCDLTAEARRAILTVRPLAGSAPLRIVGPLGHSVAMRGDAAAVRRVIINLLANSIRHTPAGGIIVALDTLRRRHSWNILSVSDSGCGFDPEVISRLRAGESELRSGTGLGLHIAQRIVAAHGGVLEIESETGVGTTVRAILRADLASPRGKATRSIRIRATGGTNP